MTIVTIKVADPSNPQEVQQWLNANPSANIVTAFVQTMFWYLITNP